jgi:hypothetical protein
LRTDPSGVCRSARFDEVKYPWTTNLGHELIKL